MLLHSAQSLINKALLVEHAGPQHLQPPSPPVDLLQLLQQPVQRSRVPQPQQANPQWQASEVATCNSEPQAPAQQQPLQHPYQPPLLTQQPVQLPALPLPLPPQQRSQQLLQMLQQHQAPASPHSPSSQVQCTLPCQQHAPQMQLQMKHQARRLQVASVVGY